MDDKVQEKMLDQDVPNKYGYGIRHIQSVIFFLCITTSFIARGHLGVTIVAMTINSTLNVKDNINTINYTQENSTLLNNTKEYTENLKGISTVINTNDTTLEVINTDDLSKKNSKSWFVYRTYNWSKPVQEMVLTAFFLGYCLMLFPISIVCQRWGGKVPIQLSMFVNGVVSILTPWMALWGGWQAVCVCRLLQGISQAGTYPGIQTLLAKWVPISERATMSSYVYTGSAMGNIIGFQLSGLVSDAFGWPATFWTIGLLCLITGTILTIFAAKSPAVHMTISDEEKQYIMRNNETSASQKSRAPLKAILTSKPVWANFATHVGSGVSFVFFLTQIPTYIHYILGVNVKNSGVLTSVPYVASFFCSIGLGILSDFLTNRKIISIKNARRISNSISQVGVAAALIGASYANSVTVAIICFIACKCCEVGIHTGWMVNHIDIAPNYSGTLMAIGSTQMNMLIVVLPLLVSNIVIDMASIRPLSHLIENDDAALDALVFTLDLKTPRLYHTGKKEASNEFHSFAERMINVEAKRFKKLETNVYQWRIMMFVVAGIAFIPNLFFVFFMSADVQPWNDGEVSEAVLKNVHLESKNKDKDRS